MPRPPDATVRRPAGRVQRGRETCDQPESAFTLTVVGALFLGATQLLKRPARITAGALVVIALSALLSRLWRGRDDFSHARRRDQDIWHPLEVRKVARTLERPQISVRKCFCDEFLVVDRDRTVIPPPNHQRRLREPRQHGEEASAPLCEVHQPALLRLASSIVACDDGSGPVGYERRERRAVAARERLGGCRVVLVRRVVHRLLVNAVRGRAAEDERARGVRMGQGEEHGHGPASGLSPDDPFVGGERPAHQFEVRDECLRAEIAARGLARTSGVDGHAPRLAPERSAKPASVGVHPLEGMRDDDERSVAPSDGHMESR